MSNAEDLKPGVDLSTSSGGSAPRRQRRKQQLKTRRLLHVVRDSGGTAQLRAELIANEQAREALQAQVLALEGTIVREAAQRTVHIATERRERLALEAQIRSLSAQLEAADDRANVATAAAVKEALRKADEDHIAGIHHLEQIHQGRFEVFRLKLSLAREQLKTLSDRYSRNQLIEQELRRYQQRLQEERDGYRQNLIDLQAKFERARVTCKKWEQEALDLRRRLRQLTTTPPEHHDKEL